MQITGKENEDDKPELWTSRVVQHGYQESYQSDWVGLWNTPWSCPGMPYPITNETKQNMQKQHGINHLFTTSLLHEHPALQYGCLIQSFIPGFWLSLTEELTGNVKSLENYYILKSVLFVKKWKLKMKGCLFITFNGYLFKFNGGLYNCLTDFCLWHTPISVGEQFLWFLKNHLMRFHSNFLLFDTS